MSAERHLQKTRGERHTTRAIRDTFDMALETFSHTIPRSHAQRAACAESARGTWAACQAVGYCPAEITGNLQQRPESLSAMRHQPLFAPVEDSGGLELPPSPLPTEAKAPMTRTLLDAGGLALCPSGPGAGGLKLIRWRAETRKSVDSEAGGGGIR